MTFAVTNVDFYDIEIINGAHIGVSMQPSNTAAGSSPYSCGAPGSNSPTSSETGACNWDFNPPSNDYQWVTEGGSPCTANSECTTAGTTCGLSFNPGHSELLQKTCGSLLGYWSADQICGMSPTYGSPFYCQTYWDLYACVGTGAQSCYQQGASSTCCGCANWWELGI